MTQRKRSGVAPVLQNWCTCFGGTKTTVPGRNGCSCVPYQHHARTLQNKHFVLVAVGMLGGVPAGGDLEVPHRETGGGFVFRADETADAAGHRPSFHLDGRGRNCSQSMIFMACALVPEGDSPIFAATLHWASDPGQSPVNRCESEKSTEADNTQPCISFPQGNYTVANPEVMLETARRRLPTCL